MFLDLAAYYIITQCNAGQYYPDYAYNHPLFTPEFKIYSDSTVSRFLSEISLDDSIQLQNEWNVRLDFATDQEPSPSFRFFTVRRDWQR